MKCCECNKESHKGCTGLSRDSYEALLKSNNWACDKCLNPPTSTTLPTQNNVEEKSEPKRTGTFGNLRILQWNADGLSPKIAELDEYVHKNKIDVVLIQETKLTVNKPTPAIKGFTPVRADRPNSEFPGGGLLTYVKHNIAYRKIGSAKTGNVEAVSVSIQQKARKWLDITNVYIPPRSEESEISWIPVSDAGIIAGDLNGHSQLWDHKQPPDKMGEKIVDFLIKNNLICCNTGAPTRINRNTGGESTPDVTLVTANLNNRIEWSTAKDLGSDHIPITIVVQNGYTRRHNTKQRRKRWKRVNCDWENFAEQIEKSLEKTDNSEKGLNQRVKEFTDLLTNAGHSYIGKTIPRTNKTWMSPKVRAAVKKRNLLRRDVANKRKEWLEACREATELAAEAKQEVWEEYLEGVEANADPVEMWRTINSLNGTPDSLAPNEAIIHKGKAVTTNPKKADLFAKHYAGVSRLQFTSEERAKNREFKIKMRTNTADEECCKDFDMTEMNNAIKNMKKKGAAGKDDIPPSFLKNLGPNAKKELLEIFNVSFRTGKIPASWTHAIIIPLLKTGKPASQIASYRPISLTSCLVKTLERMVNNRLYYIAETKGWITNTQAGFRKQRSCEDQILRINQSISDGFQAKPAKRTILVLLDYSKAYDRVWRQDLMLDMINMGVPMQMMRWIRAFISNRMAQVLYNGSYSRPVRMDQGLPQGAVLSPLLFLFFIDGLTKVVPEGVDEALFADDASIWTSNTDLNIANRKIQLAIDAIADWSKTKKMEINVNKSEVTFFSTSTHESKWRPNLTLFDSPVPFNDSPKFLGVHLDRTLSFQKHTLYVADKVSKRCRILASLAGKEWGWKKRNLRSVYLAMQRSVMDYAAPAWQPWISKTQMNKLEVAQNKALRLISGQYASTPVEALRLESGLQSYTTVSKQHSAIAIEKAERLQPYHPKNIALQNEVRHRSKIRSSWRVEAKKIVNSLPIATAPKEPLPSPFQQPWLPSEEDDNCPQWKVYPKLPDKSTPVQNPSPFSTRTRNTPWSMAPANVPNINELVESVIQLIDHHNIDTTIYTDGSCTAGTEDGGSAAVITTGSARYPVVLETIQKKGGKLTSSYDEEKAAMLLALNWMKTNNQYTDTIICSDSQSLLYSIDSLMPNTADIRKLLDSMKGRTFIHWVPSHVNVPGNELADKAAKEATRLEALDPVPLSFSTAKAFIKREVKDPPPQHPTVEKTYKNMSMRRDQKACKSRMDASLLAQLRSGHCLKLAHYKHRIDDSVSDSCPDCSDEPQTVQHWMDCPAHIQKRLQIFGRASVTLGALSEFPAEVLTYARATL